MSAYVLSVVAALLSITGILEMLRRRRVREKYAVLWLIIGIAVLIIGLMPSLLTRASNLLGVEVPANLLFFAAGLILLMVSMQQSAEISRLEEETRTLAEEVALMNLRISQIPQPSPSTSTDQEPDNPESGLVSDR